MSRGISSQPEQECEFCNKPLPAQRHPKMRFCDTVCRQRSKYQRLHATQGLKCLDCGKVFTRVGSHVVQVHGYESVLEYRRDHGLMAKETRLEEFAEKMRDKVKPHSIDNLVNGKPTRFVKGGNHGEHVSKFWRDRKKKSEYKILNSNLRGNIRL